MRTLKHLAALTTFCWCFSATADDKLCNEYLTKICGTGADVEVTQTKLEKNISAELAERNNAKADEVVEASENALADNAVTGHDNAAANDVATEDDNTSADDAVVADDTVAQDKSAQETNSDVEQANTNTADTTNQNNLSSSNTAIQNTVNIEQYRDGSTTQRLKYVAHKLPFGNVLRFLREWLDLLTFLLAGLAVWFARNAWRAAREDVTETKHANNIQNQAFLGFHNAQVRWGSQHFPGWPAVQLNIRVKNNGKSAAFDISQIKYNLFSGHLIVDPNDASKNILFTGALPDAKVFDKDGLAMTSLNPGDSVCFHAHIPLLMNSDLPVELPADWDINFTAMGEFTFRDAVFNKIRACEIGVVSGDDVSVEFPSGVSVIGTDNAVEGQVIQTNNEANLPIKTKRKISATRY